MKKITAFVYLYIFMLCTSLWAQTEEDFQVNLTADSNGVLIVKYNGTAREVRIPAAIQGMPVREIGKEAFRRQSDNTVTAVIIPEGVTTIGNNAFSFCEQLVTVTLPSTLINISTNAFNGCRSLKTINLPEGLATIGERAFKDCLALTSIDIPDSVTTIQKGAFSNSGITSITWPSKVTTILGVSPKTNDEGMFQNCRNLQTVVISEGVTAIGSDTFKGCTALNAITLPSTLRQTGGSMQGCTALKSITIPNGLTTLGSGTFRNCTSLVSIDLPSTLQEIYMEAFENCSSLTTINILESVTVIKFQGSVFKGCSKLPLSIQANMRKLGYTGSF
jgi:hypothetical protein